MAMASEATPLILRPYQRGTLPWDPNREKVSGVLVLITLALERFVYYALISNLFLYLNRGQRDVAAWAADDALTAIFVTSGLSYLLCPLAGILADTLVGRYWTILIGFVVYIAALTTLALLSKNLLQVIGCDLNCSLQPAHVDKFHNMTNNTTSPVAKELYYMSGGGGYAGPLQHSNGYRIAMNNHSMANVNESVIDGNNDETVNSYDHPPCVVHVYAILIAIALAVALIKANLAPFGAEQIKYGGQSSTRTFFNFYYWCVNVGSLLGIGVCSYVAQDVDDGFFWMFVSNVVCLALAAVVFASGSSPLLYRPPRRSDVLSRPSCLDYAKIRYGGSYHEETVNDVKQLVTITLLFACLLPYWLVIFQVQTGFQAQGVHLRVSLVEEADKRGFQIPTAWLTLFNQLVIIVLIPLMNVFVYPMLDRRGVRVPLLVRIAIGMSFSMIASLDAGLLQHFALQYWNNGYAVSQVLGGTVYNASDLSIMYQVPQYALVGTAEVFAGVAGLEFAYSASPRLLQGVVTGIYWALEGAGSILGSGLISALSPVWIKDDPDFFSGHLDYYFYLLALMQALTFALFSLWLTWQLCKGRRRISPCGSSDTSQNSADGSSTTVRGEGGGGASTSADDNSLIRSVDR